MTSSERQFGTIGVIGLGTMGAGIAEVFARNGFAVVGVELNDEARRARPPAPRALDRPGGDARQDHRGRAERAARPDLASTSISTTSPTPTSSSRRSWSRWRSRRSIFRELDEIVAPGGDPGHQHLVAVGHRDLHRQLPPRPGRRRALLQPGAGAEPRRDRPHRRHRARGARGRQGPGRHGSARTPSSAATRPASSPTRCCSATSTTPCRCTRASTPPARTSTPRCGSAAATRWARWRCST